LIRDSVKQCDFYKYKLIPMFAGLLNEGKIPLKLFMGRYFCRIRALSL